MFNEYKNLTGIYAIENTVNNKVYIGSASVCFRKRFKEHINSLKRSCHHSQHLQRSFDKYGFECFRFLVLEEVDPKECIKREQIWLNIIKPEYNISPTAGSTLGLKISQKGRMNMSKSKKGTIPWNKGKKVGDFKTKESFKKRALTLAKKGINSGRKAKKVTVKSGNLEVSFLTMQYCADFCNISLAGISKKLKNNNQCTIKGYEITLVANQ